MTATTKKQRRLALTLVLAGALFTMGAKCAEQPIRDFQTNNKENEMNLNPLATAGLLMMGLSQVPFLNDDVTAERRYTAIETFNYRYAEIQ